MRLHPATIPAAVALTLLLAPAGLAAPDRLLGLPVLDPSRDAIASACWRADRLELWLASGASRAAARSRSLALVPPGLSGVAAVDRVAAALGATLEPMFTGESAPPEGSADTDFTAFHIVAIPPGVSLADAIARFEALPEVRAASPIGIVPVSGAPNDSLWFRTWWLDQANGRHVRALDAWNLTQGDTSIVIAICDTGVIPYHPDLGGSSAGGTGNRFINRFEQAGAPGVDDDGNGFVDDVAGWDFVDLSNNADVQPGEDWDLQDNDPNDYAGHGTAVAGLASAIVDNGIGLPGLAPRCRMLPVRLGWSTFSAPLGLVDMAFAAQSIRYATRMGASVINCSFASRNQFGLDAAVSAATKAGVTVVAAAGNNGQDHYLADRVDVISVASSNADDLVASSSNKGPYVDLTAPGVFMATTYIARPTADSLGRRQPAYIGPPTAFGGTSFASPLVAATAALLQSRRLELSQRPLHPMAVQLRLRETTDDISDVNVVTGYGTGRLNAYRALTETWRSQAWGASARTVGAAVAWRDASGDRFAWATTDQRLLIVDAATGDTLARAPLGANAAPRSVAAADVGGAIGPELFVALANGRVAGFGADGAPLPGWPQAAVSGTLPMQGGPAIGDVDGDGLPEIVCGDDAGNVYVWRADGTRLTGFPAATNATGIGVPVALADLDGVPGAEIVAATRDGELHVFGADGVERGGWPQYPGGTPTAPLVATWGGRAIVLCATGAQVHAFEADGTPRFVADLGGTLSQDPALGDLDGDGVDEVVVATATAHAIAAIDSGGQAYVGPGWPATLPAAPGSAPLLGPLDAVAGADVLVYTGGGLLALGDSAKVLPTFPKPGGAGVTSTLLDLDGDGSTEVAAGAGPDSVLYTYDAGAGTWTGAAPWPTARGNFARSGSRNGAPGLVRSDTVPPAQVDDLRGEWVEGVTEPGGQGTGVYVLRWRWTTPGDDGEEGRTAGGTLRLSTDSTFASSVRTYDLFSGYDAGVSLTYDFGPQPTHVGWFARVQHFDEWGNLAGESNLGRLEPLVPAAPLPLSLRASIDAGAILFRWTSPGWERQYIDLHDVMGRKIATLRLPTEYEGVERWVPRDDGGRAVRAGIYFARLVSGSDVARTRVVWLP